MNKENYALKLVDEIIIHNLAFEGNQYRLVPLKQDPGIPICLKLLTN